MKVLFINPPKERCGVHQYGLRLYDIMQSSPELKCGYSHRMDAPEPPDIVVYNWHPIIDPGMSAIGFMHPGWQKVKRVVVYHDGDINQQFVDGVIFSDPTMTSTHKLRIIGRPLAEFLSYNNEPITADGRVRVGVFGFCGAWAVRVVERVSREYEHAVVRLHLPFSDHCDAGGAAAMQMVQQCAAAKGAQIEIEASHDFKSEGDLLVWLSNNHINCFVRDAAASRGISSALDLALSVRRPVAVNYHPMFRHVTGASPSICLDSASIREILQNGLSPLVPIYERNSRERVRAEIVDALKAFLSNAPDSGKASS